jgi:hypothetical protein
MFDGEEYALIPKRRLSRVFKSLHREISNAIYRYDPIRLRACHVPRDEYDGEAMRVAARLRQATSPADVKGILIQVIGETFEEIPDAETPALDTAAEDIWRAWRTYQMKT